MDGALRARRLWPSCLATVAVLAALIGMLQPALSAVASPVPAEAPRPVRVRVTPAVGALGGGPLRPGAPGHRPVRVHNDGELPLRYTLSVPADGALARLILLEVRVVDGACDAGTFAASRQVVAGPAPLAEVVRQGGRQAGRVLDPGASELLCARVELPQGVPVPAGSTVTDAVLRVHAVQA